MTISDTDPVYAEPHEARTIHLPEMPPIPTRVEGCDAPDGPVYYDPHRGVTCRCIVCGRCGHHTGNSNQGHYWAFCHVTRKTEEFHFCCPDDCELHPIETAAGVQSTAAPADGKTVRGLPASGPARVEAGGPAVELREQLARVLAGEWLPEGRTIPHVVYVETDQLLTVIAGWLREESTHLMAAEREGAASHQDLCACDRWPATCLTGYRAFPVSTRVLDHAADHLNSTVERPTSAPVAADGPGMGATSAGVEVGPPVPASTT